MSSRPFPKIPALRALAERPLPVCLLDSGDVVVTEGHGILRLAVAPADRARVDKAGFTKEADWPVASAVREYLTPPAGPVVQVSLGDLRDWAGDYVGITRCPYSCRKCACGKAAGCTRCRVYGEPKSKEADELKRSGRMLPNNSGPCTLAGIEITDPCASIDRNLLALFLGVLPAAWDEVVLEARGGGPRVHLISPGKIYLASPDFTLLINGLRDLPSESTLATEPVPPC